MLEDHPSAGVTFVCVLLNDTNASQRLRVGSIVSGGSNWVEVCSGGIALIMN